MGVLEKETVTNSLILRATIVLFFPCWTLFILFLFWGGDWTTVFFVFKRSHILGMRVGGRGQHRDRNSFIHILGTQDPDRKRRRSSDLLFFWCPLHFRCYTLLFPRKEFFGSDPRNLCGRFSRLFSGAHNMRPYVNKEVCKIPTFFLFEIFFLFREAAVKSLWRC